MSAYQNHSGHYVVGFTVNGHRYTFGRVPGSPNAFTTIKDAEDYEALARTLLAYEAESGLFKTTDLILLHHDQKPDKRTIRGKEHIADGLIEG